MGIKVIAKLGVIDQLAGKQSFDSLPPPLGRTARPILSLPSMLGADSSNKPIPQSRLRSQQRTKSSTRHPSSLRLFHQEVPKQSIPGEIPPQHRVQRHPIPSIQPSLSQQHRRHIRSPPLPTLKHS